MKDEKKHEDTTIPEQSVILYQNKEGVILQLGVDFDVMDTHYLMKYQSKYTRYVPMPSGNYYDIGEPMLLIVEEIKNCKLIK